MERFNHNLRIEYLFYTCAVFTNIYDDARTNAGLSTLPRHFLQFLDQNEGHLGRIPQMTGAAFSGERLKSFHIPSSRNVIMFILLINYSPRPKRQPFIYCQCRQWGPQKTQGMLQMSTQRGTQKKSKGHASPLNMAILNKVFCDGFLATLYLSQFTKKLFSS